MKQTKKIQFVGKSVVTHLYIDENLFSNKKKLIKKINTQLNYTHISRVN